MGWVDKQLEPTAPVRFFRVLLSFISFSGVFLKPRIMSYIFHDECFFPISFQCLLGSGSTDIEWSHNFLVELLLELRYRFYMLYALSIRNAVLWLFNISPTWAMLTP